ncbi:MAG: DNA polymerase III subunit gamma/tau, partial [Candidatus Buchananbacteria bacterium]|nr:DNA polymerase III subunit gamma/tau [Candidatus Buchananbacteria bacterium]
MSASDQQFKGQFKWSICGHERNQDFLQASIQRDQVAHAYLFWGPSHVGKQTTARTFAQTLLCEDATVRPCGTCSGCRQFLNGNHPDVYV